MPPCKLSINSAAAPAKRHKKTRSAFAKAGLVPALAEFIKRPQAELQNGASVDEIILNPKDLHNKK